MKRGLFTTISIVLLATACRKADVQAPAASATANEPAYPATPPPAHPERGLLSSINNGNMVVTDWEPSGGFTRTITDNGTLKYTATRSFHEITQALLDQGAVLAFAKGYNFADTSNAMRAMGLPFQFFLPIERMNWPVYWEYVKKVGGVDVNLQMKPESSSMFSGAQNNIRLRYFLFTAQELQRRGLDARSVRSLSYDQLVAMYNLMP